ncbi:MAG: ABC transporter substrate-binding protein, partial [bacterium]
RKTVLLVLITLALTFTHPAEAQKPGKVYRIGYLTVSRIHPAFRQSLRELGYVEGKNLTIEFRQRKRGKTYLGLAKELVRLKVDLILAVGMNAARAAKQATRTIPIVMGNSSTDPVRGGLIDSLARPGGNITGVIDILPDLAGKRLELLKEIFPNLSRVAHLSSASSSSGPAHLKETKAAARAMGVRVQALAVRSPGDLERAFRAAAEGGAEALVVVGVSFFIPHRQRIVNLIAKYRLPAIYTHQRWVPAGGLISYTTDSDVRNRRVAHFVDKIFKGAKPADLPVEQPTKFNLEINLKTAKKLGVTIPPEVLLRATRVIK